MKFQKALISLFALTLLTSPGTSWASGSDDSTKEVFVWGVSDYPWNCNYSDLSRVNDLSNEIINTFPSTWTKRKTMDNSVTRSDFLNNVGYGDFVFYLGHGLKDNYRLHFGANHPWAEDDSANNIWRSDLQLGPWGSTAGGDVDYVNFHTCNFLRALDWNERWSILAMMDGTHMQLGYGSTMWMYPGQMQDYATRLKNGEYVKDAWVNAAKVYQPKAAPNVDVYAVVTAHKSTIYDKMSSGDSNDPPGFLDENANEFYLYSYLVASAQ
ncbi:DUF6345 domain-containing protein [Effusibacillus consociatus]|uniref:DUF6345 domain-containing protein n=1 Tax=Effusibacillus consociatus TaxID=1117041 RepID=A0ABV9Q6K0_9BACL